MRINKLFMIFAAAGVFALTGCSNEDGPKGSPEEGSLYIQFSQGDGSVASRAVAGEVANNTQTTFTDGGLFFTDDAGTIYRYIRITNDGSTGTLSLTNLKEGTFIENVKNVVTMCHVFGNIDFEDASFSTIDDVREKFPIDLKSQTDENFGVSNATLYGAGNVVTFTGSLPAYLAYVSNGGSQTAEKEVKVDVKARPARFEISSLTGKDSIYSYDLAGIYINNFYYVVDATGMLHSTSPANYHDFGSNAEKYARTTITNGEYKFPDWYEMLFDDKWNGSSYDPYPTTSTMAENYITVPLNPNPAPVKVWAYNFFPIANVIPQIVFHLENVKLTEDNGSTNIPFVNKIDASDTAYLTAKRYREVSTSGYVNLEGGWVYKMAVTFTAKDLGSEPGGPDEPDPDDEFDVWVEVELIPWKTKEVIAEF